MGLIKAAVGAIGGTLADQWKEFFTCDAIDENVLVVKGTKRVSGRSSNTKGEQDVISDGSAIAVADGQCMMVVEQGKVVELSAEPGIFIYKNDLAPSIFAGNLTHDLTGIAKDLWSRFQFGGGTGKDQRVYYFNTKELMGNKYGTATPIPFKVMIDPSINRFLGISVRCNGEYSYKIVNPMLFYRNVCGNVQKEYTREEIESQLKSELLTALQPALAKVSAKGVDYADIPLYTKDITEALNEELSASWTEKRGLQVVGFGVNSISVSDEDKAKIQSMQQAAFMSDPSLAAGNIAMAQADAMRTAAANENGAMMGFMGMGMAAQASGVNANDLFAMGQQQAQNPQNGQPQQGAPGQAGQQPQMQQNVPPQGQINQQPQNMQQASQNPQAGMAATAEAAVTAGGVVQQAKQNGAAGGSWTCQCGQTAHGNFCPECGSPKPVAPEGWTCSCGAVNKGKFCTECGAKKPAAAPLYRCDKCGWEPEDPTTPPKFCPNCGDIFDENDVK